MLCTACHCRHVKDSSLPPSNKLAGFLARPVQRNFFGHSPPSGGWQQEGYPAVKALRNQYVDFHCGDPERELRRSEGGRGTDRHV